MTLREAFENGLTSAEYTLLLDEDQRALHATYERRALVSGDAIERIRAAGTSRVLVITEPWCGDSLAILPGILRLFDEVGSEVRIVRRDEHPELIDQYLTNGGRAVPIAVVLDESFNERFHWGPRPQPAQRLFEENRDAIAAGTITKADIHKQIRAFYAKDNNQTLVEEIASQFATA